jgi:hypothetical protein
MPDKIPNVLGYCNLLKSTIPEINLKSTYFSALQLAIVRGSRVTRKAAPLREYLFGFGRLSPCGHALPQEGRLPSQEDRRS